MRLYADEANKTDLVKQVMHYYTEEQVPVLTSLVKNYLTFNHWHSDIPGVRIPFIKLPTNAERICRTQTPTAQP
jgi:phospholipase C